MLVMLEILGSVFTGCVLLNLLEPVTRRYRLRVQQYRDRQEVTPPLYQDIPCELSEPPPPFPEVPQDQTAAFYFCRVINDGGLMGLLFISILLASLPLNTGILAEAFEILLDRPGRVLAQLQPFGMDLEVTDLHLYGLSLALALLLLGAAYAESCQSRSSLRWFLLLAGLVCLWGLEVGVSAFRGYVLAMEDGRNLYLYAAFNGLQAHVCAVAEVVSGIWALHLFVLPLLQAALWAVVAPFRAIRRWCISLYRSYRMHHPRRRVLTPPDKPGVFVRAAAYLDEGLFDPLRTLDRFVQGLFRRSRKEVSYV